MAVQTPTSCQVALAPFPLLAEPSDYTAGTFDYYSNCSRSVMRQATGTAAAPTAVAGDACPAGRTRMLSS
jgi:hypothetical protein